MPEAGHYASTFFPLNHKTLIFLSRPSSVLYRAIWGEIYSVLSQHKNKSCGHRRSNCESPIQQVESIKRQSSREIWCEPAEWIRNEGKCRPGGAETVEKWCQWSYLIRIEWTMRWLWPAFLVSCFAAMSWGKSLAATSETERRDSYLIARDVILKVNKWRYIDVRYNVITCDCLYSPNRIS